MRNTFKSHFITGLSLVGCLCLISLALWAQQSPGLTPPQRPESSQAQTAAKSDPAKSPIQVGEKLSFNVSWSNFVTAARLDMELAGQGAFFGQEGYQIRTRVETVGYVRSLFAEVDNHYTSYVDVKTLLPYRVQNTTRQGTKSDDTTVTIDQQRQSAKYSDGSEIKLLASTYDLPALVYALRSRGLKTGEKAKFNTFYGTKIFEVEAEAKGTERLTTQAGEFDAVRIDLLAKGKDSQSYRVRLWLSADERRLPLLITSKPSIGEVKAELAQVSISSDRKVPLSPAQDASPDTGKVASLRPIISEVGELPSEFERTLPFGVGERLSYDVSWLNLKSIGKVSFEVRQIGKLDKKRVFELVSEAHSEGVVRAVVNLHDRFVCYAETDSLVPVKTETFIQEGKRRKQVTADYNSNDLSIRLTNGTHFSAPAKTLDLVSLFYTVRASDLKVGSTLAFNFLNANHRQNSVEIKVVKVETIQTSFGPRSAIQLDIFNSQTKQLLAQSWISNDTRKIPLYFVAKLAFGEIRLQLASPPPAK
ncbi:MAG TPA: DUF3108 domain-containing protein [Blastocatellia bacterium]|nr:DUF3108 domain-containing protein [Blastocatellia bacterium]